ncbi:MAG: hypothetical protein CMN21_10450 [Rubinisphaera sp.]|nr:hypothetical protein [Rubinisphaera sp.]
MLSLQKTILFVDSSMFLERILLVFKTESVCYEDKSFKPPVNFKPPANRDHYLRIVVMPLYWSDKRRIHGRHTLFVIIVIVELLPEKG